MKWNELSRFHKVMLVIGCTCGSIYVVLQMMAMMGTLETPLICHVLWAGFWAPVGVILWESQRKAAMAMFVVAALSVVMIAAEIFI